MMKSNRATATALTMAATMVLVVAMTTMTTTLGASSSSSSSSSHHPHQRQRHLRADFVKAMDEAMHGDGDSQQQVQRRIQRHERFLSRLAEVATPASQAIPGYQRQPRDGDDRDTDTVSASMFDIDGLGDGLSGFVQDVIEEFVVDTKAAAAAAAASGLGDGGRRRDLEEWQGYGVNLTDYALKYIGCSNIKTWSDELAEAGDGDYNSVLKTERFVVLRLCPRDECSNYNKYGCMEKYGDYVVKMETYLQIMAETFFTQYQEYCQTCYQCMSAFSSNGNNANGNNGDDAVNNNNNNGGRRLNDDAVNNNNNLNDDANNANGDDAVNDNNANDGDDAYNNGNNNQGNGNNNNDDDFYNYYQSNANQMNNGGCEYYAVCEDYETACDDYDYVANDLEQYFGCAEFYIGNSLGYLGPHCKSDGKTIALGIFHDANCYEYNADLNEMSNYMTVSDNDLQAYYSKNCISCLASDGYTLEVDNNGDGYSDVSDICGALYDESAKCNKYMGNTGDYASESQEGTEDIVCGFIHNLVTNSYDEYGEIYLKGESWTEYLPHMKEMSQWQKYVLSGSVLGCVCLLFTAGYLHRQITQRRFVWFPRAQKGYSSNDPMMGPQNLTERGNSGIIQGRSQSSSFEMRDGGVMG